MPHGWCTGILLKSFDRASCSEAPCAIAGGLGAYSGAVASGESRAWASATPGAVGRDGAAVSSCRVGDAVLSHLEAKPVSMRLPAARPGDDLLEPCDSSGVRDTWCKGAALQALQCRSLEDLSGSLLNRSDCMYGAHCFWACAAGVQSGTSTAVQQNSYTVIWQASSQLSSIGRTEMVPGWRARWRLSAGQLQLRRPSLRPGTQDGPCAVFAALQRMLAFLQTGGLAGDASFFQAQSSLLDLSSI